MDPTRRNALTALAGVGLLAGAAACSKKTDTEPTPTELPPPQVDGRFPTLPETLLVNRARAFDVMKKAGVEAIVCAHPENIYYLTNHYPQLVKMGMQNLSYAILPLDPQRAPVLISGEFAFYLAATERATPELVDVRLYTSPAEPESYMSAQNLIDRVGAPANPSFLPTAQDFHPLNRIESERRTDTSKLSNELAVTSEAALLRVARDLSLAGKRVAVDDEALAVMFERAELPIVRRDAEYLLRTIRLQKSDAEIILAKYAAKENAEASLAAAKTVRDGATFQEVRQAYAMACADRLLTPSFMVVDGVIPDMVPSKIEEGRAFLIDCVSHHQNYHGDYGRTVCIGEPTREIAKATNAVATVWDRLLPKLKPGLRYSEIAALATKAFERTNSDVALVCNPHSVGLKHTDEPGVAGHAHWVKDDLELVEGMVLSVDLPVVDVGLGGSAHLEDLVLITADGAEPLNDMGDRVIII